LEKKPHPKYKRVGLFYCKTFTFIINNCIIDRSGLGGFKRGEDYDSIAGTNICGW
jgi:hypothetical protein